MRLLHEFGKQWPDSKTRPTSEWLSWTAFLLNTPPPILSTSEDSLLFKSMRRHRQPEGCRFFYFDQLKKNLIPTISPRRKRILPRPKFCRRKARTKKRFRPLQGQSPCWIFSSSSGLEKILNKASNPSRFATGETPTHQKIPLRGYFCASGRIRTFVAQWARDLQSLAFDHSATDAFGL